MVQINWQKRYAELKSDYDTLEEKYRQLEQKILNLENVDFKFKTPLFSSGELGIVRLLFFDKSKEFIPSARLILGYHSTKRGSLEEYDDSNVFKVQMSRIRKKLAPLNCYIISEVTYPARYIMDDYDKILLCKINDLDPIATLGLDPAVITDRKYPIVFRRYGSKVRAEYDYPHSQEDTKRRNKEAEYRKKRREKKLLADG